MAKDPVQRTCECGCGQVPLLAPQTCRSKGWIRDEPKRFVNGHQNRKSPFEYIEQDCGHDTLCWIWQRAKDQNGYGQRWDPARQRAVRTHILYFEQEYGPVPEGLELDHLCRVPACCNPDHLEPVTRAVNTRRGNAAKLNEAQVTEIRRRLATEAPLALAHEFGVARRTIYSLREEGHWVLSGGQSNS